MTGRHTLTEDPHSFPRPFGSYLLISHLGKGGMGEVFLAKHRRGGSGQNLCVVKMLRQDLVRDREYVTRFIDEAMIVVTLNHRNICHVFDVGKTGQGQYYLAMEYLSGIDAKTLADRAEKLGEGVAPAACVQVAIDILSALDYAHKRKHPRSGEPLKLVHRDVSPHNVVIGFDGISKLIDFGLASSTLKIEQTAPNVVMGKMAYMAPEQARGDSINARADQFAAAMIIYELLSGERFYAGLTANEIWNTVGRGGFTPRNFKKIDRPLRALLDKALHKEAKKRFPDCQAFRDALATYQEKTFPMAGGDAVRVAVTDLMGKELEDEWERLAGFTEVSLSGYAEQLEKTGRMAQVIAQAQPGAGPKRELVPPPQAARPNEPTAILNRPPPRPPPQAAAKASLSGPSLAPPTDEETELVSRKRPLAPAELTEVVRDRSQASSETTELVHERSLSGAAQKLSGPGVVVVHPSQAHQAAVQPHRGLVAAVGGGAALLLLSLGALLASFALGGSSREATSSGNVASLVEPDDPSVNQPGATGRAPSRDDEVGDPGDQASKRRADDRATDAVADDDGDDLAVVREKPRRSPRAKTPSDRKRRTRADKKARRDLASATPTSGEAEAKAEREKTPPTRTQPAANESVSTGTTENSKPDTAKTSADAPATAKPRASRKTRRQNEGLLRKGKKRMRKKGYEKTSAWPSKVRGAYDQADADLNDASLARRFERLSKDAAIKKSAVTPANQLGLKRLRRGARACVKAQQSTCAALFSDTLSKNIPGMSANQRRQLLRKVDGCERTCGIR